MLAKECETNFVIAYIVRTATHPKIRYRLIKMEATLSSELYSSTRSFLLLAVLTSAFLFSLLSTNILRRPKNDKFHIKSPGVLHLMACFLAVITMGTTLIVVLKTLNEWESPADARLSSWVLAGYVVIVLFGIAVLCDECAKDNAAKPDRSIRRESHLAYLPETLEVPRPETFEAPELSPLSWQAMFGWVALILVSSVFIPLLLEGGPRRLMRQFEEARVWSVRI